MTSLTISRCAHCRPLAPAAAIWPASTQRPLTPLTGTSSSEPSHRVAANPTLGVVAPVLLYSALGPTLPNDAAPAAALWAIARRRAMSRRPSHSSTASTLLCQRG